MFIKIWINLSFFEILVTNDVMLWKKNQRIIVGSNSY
jgi:hypothetical protein